MERISLIKRLRWLKDGHADHLDYVEKRMRVVASTPMTRYFAPDQKQAGKLAGHLHMDVEAVKRMTYLEVARVIHRMYGQEDMKAAAIEAAWDLAYPYIIESMRRKKKNVPNRTA